MVTKTARLASAYSVAIEHYIEDNVLYVKLWTRQIRGHYEPETFSAPLERNTSIIPILERLRDFKQK